MPKPSRKPAKIRRRASDQPQAVETRASDMLMAAWGVALLTTLICEVVAALLYLYAGLRPIPAQLRMLTGLAHFAALVMGLIVLAMIPLLLKLRRDPPAPAIVTMALIIGGLPIIGLLLQLVV